MKLWLKKVIFIEKADFCSENAPATFYGLAPDQPCALRYGPNLYYKSSTVGKNG